MKAIAARWGVVAAVFALVLLPARAARADLALLPGLVGSRVFYAGLEAAFSLAKTTPDTSAGLLGIGPTAELHFTPRWSVQAHGSLAFGFGTVFPDSWRQLGVRAVWRATPAQFASLGLGVAQTNAGRRFASFDPGTRRRPQPEDISPQLDLGLGLWELDLDPIRVTPVARFAVTLLDGSYLLGLGISAQYGFGAIRTTSKSAFLRE
jgi:hypothetical protein